MSMERDAQIELLKAVEARRSAMADALRASQAFRAMLRSYDGEANPPAVKRA